MYTLQQTSPQPEDKPPNRNVIKGRGRNPLHPITRQAPFSRQASNQKTSPQPEYTPPNRTVIKGRGGGNPLHPITRQAPSSRQTPNTPKQEWTGFLWYFSILAFWDFGMGFACFFLIFLYLVFWYGV